MKTSAMSKIIALALPLLLAVGVSAASAGRSSQLLASSSMVSAAPADPPAINRPANLPPAGQPYRSLKMASATDGWVVEQGGLIKRYMAGQWLDYPSPVTTTLNAVAATATDAWAVGEGNTILHLVGNNWQVVASPAPSQAAGPGTHLEDADRGGAPRTGGQRPAHLAQIRRARFPRPPGGCQCGGAAAGWGRELSAEG